MEAGSKGKAATAVTPNSSPYNDIASIPNAAAGTVPIATTTVPAEATPTLRCSSRLRERQERPQSKKPPPLTSPAPKEKSSQAAPITFSTWLRERQERQKRQKEQPAGFDCAEMPKPCLPVGAVPPGTPVLCSASMYPPGAYYPEDPNGQGLANYPGSFYQGNPCHPGLAPWAHPPMNTYFAPPTVTVAIAKTRRDPAKCYGLGDVHIKGGVYNAEMQKLHPCYVIMREVASLNYKGSSFIPSCIESGRFCSMVLNLTMHEVGFGLPKGESEGVRPKWKTWKDASAGTFKHIEEVKLTYNRIVEMVEQGHIKNTSMVPLLKWSSFTKFIQYFRRLYTMLHLCYRFCTPIEFMESKLMDCDNREQAMYTTCKWCELGYDRSARKDALLDADTEYVPMRDPLPPRKRKAPEHFTYDEVGGEPSAPRRSKRKIIESVRPAPGEKATPQDDGGEVFDVGFVKTGLSTVAKRHVPKPSARESRSFSVRRTRGGGGAVTGAAPKRQRKKRDPKKDEVSKVVDQSVHQTFNAEEMTVEPPVQLAFITRQPKDGAKVKESHNFLSQPKNIEHIDIVAICSHGAILAHNLDSGLHGVTTLDNAMDIAKTAAVKHKIPSKIMYGRTEKGGTTVHLPGESEEFEELMAKAKVKYDPRITVNSLLQAIKEAKENNNKKELNGMKIEFGDDKRANIRLDHGYADHNYEDSFEQEERKNNEKLPDVIRNAAFPLPLRTNDNASANKIFETTGGLMDVAQYIVDEYGEKEEGHAKPMDNDARNNVFGNPYAAIVKAVHARGFDASSITLYELSAEELMDVDKVDPVKFHLDSLNDYEKGYNHSVSMYFIVKIDNKYYRLTHIFYTRRSVGDVMLKVSTWLPEAERFIEATKKDTQDLETFVITKDMKEIEEPVQKMRNNVEVKAFRNHKIKYYRVKAMLDRFGLAGSYSWLFLRVAHKCNITSKDKLVELFLLFLSETSLPKLKYVTDKWLTDEERGDLNNRCLFQYWAEWCDKCDGLAYSGGIDQRASPFINKIFNKDGSVVREAVDSNVQKAKNILDAAKDGTESVEELRKCMATSGNKTGPYRMLHYGSFASIMFFPMAAMVKLLDKDADPSYVFYAHMTEGATYTKHFEKMGCVTKAQQRRLLSVTAEKFDIKVHMVENGFCEGERILYGNAGAFYDIFFDGFPVMKIEETSEGKFRVMARMPEEGREWCDLSELLDELLYNDAD